MCLNPHDPQLMRIFHDDGAFHAVCANNGGGMARDGVLQSCASPRTRATSSESSAVAYAVQSRRIPE